MIEEIWKPVVGHEKHYEVSNLGRVKSVERTVISIRKCGPVSIKRKGQFLRPGPSAAGHLTVAIGRCNSRLVHHLVLEAFIGPRPDGHEGCHWDDNPNNNIISNLRWGTRSDNLHDAVRNGKKAIGEKIKHSKLTEEAVRFIRANKNLMSMNSMGIKFGVSANAVKQVILGLTWRHVA